MPVEARIADPGTDSKGGMMKTIGQKIFGGFFIVSTALAFQNCQPAKLKMSESASKVQSNGFQQTDLDPGTMPRDQQGTDVPSSPVIEAESYSEAHGAGVVANYVGSMDNGDYLKFTGLDFSSGPRTFSARVAVTAEYAGQSLELRLDAMDGPVIGTLVVSSTGGWENFQTQAVAVNSPVGIRDLYIIARGSFGIANIDQFQFK